MCTVTQRTTGGSGDCRKRRGREGLDMNLISEKSKLCMGKEGTAGNNGVGRGEG